MSFRRKIFLLIIVATALVGVIIRSPISVIPFLYVLVALILSGLYLLIIRNSCQLVVDGERPRVFTRGASQSYSIRVRNRSFLVFPKLSLYAKLENLDGEVFKAYEFDFILNKKEENLIDLDLEFPHLGDYIFKIENIKIYGIFDFAYVNYNPKWEEAIKVVAKEYILDDFDMDTRKATIPVEFTVPTKVDGEIYEDIREYIPGDPIKNIHWKLSAHANVYMTRILKIDAISGISIFLDFNSRMEEDLWEAASINDAIVELGLAVGSYALENKRAVNLRYSENSLPVNLIETEYLSFKDRMNSLPRFSKKEDYPIELLEQDFGLRDDNIFIFTSNVSHQLLASLSTRQASGKRPIIFYIAGKGHEESQIKLKSSGLEYYEVESPEDFIEKLGGREKNEEE